MKQTKTIDVALEANSIKFAGLMEEGLRFVDKWTPTDINSGGCGIFADLLTDELDKYNIPYKIYALFEKDSKREQILKKNLNTFISNGKTAKEFGVQHVMVFIEEAIYVDSDGINNEAVLVHYSKTEITKEILKKLNDMNGIWNDVFDRECNPIIQSKLEEVFKHLSDFKSGIFVLPGKKEIHYTAKTLIEKKKERKTNLRKFFG